jgi:hypothetical protein
MLRPPPVDDAIESKSSTMPDMRREIVSAGVILTHFVEVKLTHLGEDGGLLAAEDAYPGAGSGNQSDGAAWHENSRDRARAWVLA